MRTLIKEDALKEMDFPNLQNYVQTKMMQPYDKRDFEPKYQNTRYEEPQPRSRSRSYERHPRYRSRSFERRMPAYKRYPENNFHSREEEYMPRYYERDRDEYRKSPERYQRIVINRTTESYSRETRHY